MACAHLQSPCSMGDRTYAQMAGRFDYSSLTPGLDTVQLHVLISRVSALPEDGELLRDLDAEFGELARNPLKAWSRLQRFACRAMAMWTQEDNFYESSWKTARAK